MNNVVEMGNLSQRIKAASALADALVPHEPPERRQFDIMLECLGERELRELQDVLLRSRERGFTNSTFDQDDEWLAVLADMRARIEARATLPVSIQKHLPRGTL